MPQLAEHQLRVAAVADVIIDNIPNPSSLTLNRYDIVAVCLLHDMGNILKFDLSNSHLVINKDIDVNFWQKVKDQYGKKYGADEHAASLKIARELGVNPRKLELIDAIGFETAVENSAGHDFGKKICAYCDSRVSPCGVVSLEGRFDDLRARYAHRHQEWGSEQKRLAFENALRHIEQQIFACCAIKPEQITEMTITETRERLKEFDI